MNSDEFKARRNKVNTILRSKLTRRRRLNVWDITVTTVLPRSFDFMLKYKKGKHSEYILKIQNIFVLLISSTTI